VRRDVAFGLVQYVPCRSSFRRTKAGGKLRNGVNFDLQNWLAMPIALIVATLRLILHHLNFLCLSGENNGALDLRALDERRADGRVRAVVNEEHLVKDNCVTLLQISGEFFDSNRVAFRDDILLSASFDYSHFHVALI